VDFFACHEERKVLQPFSVVLAENVEGLTAGLCSVCKKSASSFAKEFLFEGDDSAVRHAFVWNIRCIGEILRRQKSLLAKSFQIYEQGISGKCREALIRRIAVSGGVQRQDLPDFLPRPGQEFDELMSGISKIADAVDARQRRDMEKDSTAPGEDHPINVMLPMQLRNRESATRGETFLSECCGLDWRRWRRLANPAFCHRYLNCLRRQRFKATARLAAAK
jgi:hypothetical protein